MSIKFFFYKNNPEKLLELFMQQSTSNEEKRKIVDQLIKLQAKSQLWKLLNKGFDSKIVPALIELEKDNSQQLWKLLDKGFNEKIVPVLFEYEKTNPQQLIRLFPKTISEKERDKIFVFLSPISKSFVILPNPIIRSFRSPLNFLFIGFGALSQKFFM